MAPSYDLKKIRFATDAGTFERAVALLEKGKVTKFKAFSGGFSSVVLGSEAYTVFVSSRHYDDGDCTCYVAQEDRLCKHMVAVALRAVMGKQVLTEDEKRPARPPQLSGLLGTLEKKQIAGIKKSITATLRYIKPYNGPSRVWFAYQGSLQEGCARLSEIVSELPVGVESSRSLVDLLLRLDKKLSETGVDDSDGTVGGFMEEVVAMLQEYARLDPHCVKAFDALKEKQTCFGWEEPLLKMLKNR